MISSTLGLHSTLTTVAGAWERLILSVMFDLYRVAVTTRQNPKPALFMTVRNETAKMLRATGTRSAEGTKAYVKQYVEVTRDEPGYSETAAGLSQQRIGDCSRSVHELCGPGPP